MNINDQEKLRELFKRSNLRNYFTPSTPKQTKPIQLNINKTLHKNKNIQKINIKIDCSKKPGPVSVSYTPEKQRYFAQLSTRILNFPENNSKLFDQYCRNQTNENCQKLHRIIPVGLSQLNDSNASQLNRRERKNKIKAYSTGESALRNNRSISIVNSVSREPKSCINEMEESKLKAWDYEIIEENRILPKVFK